MTDTNQITSGPATPVETAGAAAGTEEDLKRFRVFKALPNGEVELDVHHGWEDVKSPEGQGAAIMLTVTVPGSKGRSVDFFMVEDEIGKPVTHKFKPSILDSGVLQVNDSQDRLVYLYGPTGWLEMHPGPRIDLRM